jgi:molybdopterin/thiamine biosynthesis adenylyltransferase
MQEGGMRKEAETAAVLSRSKVLVVGAGGLGCPAALYLAAAGVGTIALIDPEEVELSNLQRQILHLTPDLGRPKVESAQEKLTRLSPQGVIQPIQGRLTVDNLPALFAQYDFIIDGTDDLAAKFFINDGALFAGKPFSYGGILQFQGQTMTVLPGKTTCLRCLFPSPPPPGEVPTCQEAGVIGSLAGSIGIVQAAEAVKYLLGEEDLLTNRLLVYDALVMGWREVEVRKNKRCPLCGETPSITYLQAEYSETCAGEEEHL